MKPKISTRFILFGAIAGWAGASLGSYLYNNEIVVKGLSGVGTLILVVLLIGRSKKSMDSTVFQGDILADLRFIVYSFLVCTISYWSIRHIYEILVYIFGR